MSRIQTIQDKSLWNEYVASHGGHPLQLWEWGELKQAHGPWTPYRLFVLEDAARETGETPVCGAAQVLRRELPAPFRALYYIPRGPVCEEQDRQSVLAALTDWAKDMKGVVLKIEPDWTAAAGLPKAFHRSSNTVLLPRTLVLDLKKSEEQLLAEAAKRARQYIRNSEKKGIYVRRVKSREDMDTCLDIYDETAKRAGFALHDRSYYYDLAESNTDAVRVYIAEKEGRPLSFLYNIMTPHAAFELYGGMNDEGSNTHSNYLLKWTAITDAKRSGVASYDMNGLLNDGISQYKLKFSDEETMWIGTYDCPISSMYGLFDKALPGAKKLMQKVKNR